MKRHPEGTGKGGGKASFVGEILSRPEVRSEIIEIAWRTAEKRRVEEEERARKQPRLDGMGATGVGYAIYRDFEQYIKQRMFQEGLKVGTWNTGKIKFEIKRTLETEGWRVSAGHPATRFYPPGTESPNLGRRLT